jgi:LPXTG-motif cell wall-anchored protein
VSGTATGTTSTAQTVSSNRTAVDVPITPTPATSATSASSKPDGTAALASTGSTVVGPALGAGLLLLLAGGGFLHLRRRRGNAKA